ncbi:MAG: metal ABC transporter substrate-binding protein [Polyangia bacterium]|jgi:ABC-type Zn uptake system ZnuABC Zn-binding protein ZnuA|nr:metal ABC transporter substrate-binding protein [Polyangia bacterium]
MSSRYRINVARWSVGLLILAASSALGAPMAHAKLYVVASNPTFANIAEYVGGNLLKVDYITKEDEDPHFVRPKPSFAVMLSKADALVVTGLDLELWAPSLIDKSMNAKIREGQVGYIAVHDGIRLLEIPRSGSRASGGVHLFGNPHIYNGPMNAKIIATNIAIGLCKVSQANCEAFKAGAQRFHNMIDQRMFGPKLLKLFGSATLTRLTEAGKLIPFLRDRNYRGEPLVNMLGGWGKKAAPLWGLKLVTYHKNWIYFTRSFGLDVIQEVEPKPSIPPSPQSVRRLINTMSKETIKVILAANFYDESKVRMICQRVSAQPAIVAFSVHGKPGINNYFQLMDHWLNVLLEAYRRTGAIK